MPESAEPLQELPPEPVVADPADVDDQIRDVVEQHMSPGKREAETDAELEAQLEEET